ncbi:MAG: phosphoribosylformylglycinamidine synthase subunit PurQ [Chthoniobacterales bacterium]
MTKFAVIRFPGSNCDQDCIHAIQNLGIEGVSADYIWHKDSYLQGADVVVLPGGFSYGDYLRCGAIAQFSPIMAEVKKFAAAGGKVLGICNGFQILCEAGLLPGALVLNRDLKFICENRHIRVESSDSPFTKKATPKTVWQLPIAHGEGCYIADPKTLRELNTSRRILFRYSDAQGLTIDKNNPNGSCENIAGICNENRNVLGLMPHPERACDPLLGGTDGRRIFESLIKSA